MAKLSVYKDIPGYKNIYGISKNGEVIRYEVVRPYKITGYTAKYKQITLKQEIDFKGYSRVSLNTGIKEKRQIKASVHRLVYQTYVGQIPKDLQINHIDGNKSNNHISNLELCTGKENVRHAIKLGLMKSLPSEKNPGVKLDWNKVRKIRKLYDGKQFSQRTLAKQFNVSRSAIKDIIRKLSWKEK